MIDRPAGAVNAALMPLTMRVSTSSVPSLTSPPTADATTNTLSPASSTLRRPRRAEPGRPTLAAPERWGGAPPGQTPPAVPEHVARDDPLQLRGRQAEIGPDRRERDADHRGVEAVGEEDTHTPQHAG